MGHCRGLKLLVNASHCVIVTIVSARGTPEIKGETEARKLRNAVIISGHRCSGRGRCPGCKLYATSTSCCHKTWDRGKTRPVVSSCGRILEIFPTVCLSQRPHFPNAQAMFVLFDAGAVQLYGSAGRLRSSRLVTNGPSAHTRVSEKTRAV